MSRDTKANINFTDIHDMYTNKTSNNTALLSQSPNASRLNRVSAERGEEGERGNRRWSEK